MNNLESTNTLLTEFNNKEFGRIRTTVIDGEAWFVGKDVAEALGYMNTKDALVKHVFEEDKQIIQRSQNATLEIPNRGMTLINESGLYSLIFGSRLDSAKRFKRWVTNEVLPQIRQTGTYGLYKPDGTVNLDMLQKLIDQEREMQEKIKQQQLALTVKDQQISELQPKASYYDVVLNCKDLISVTTFAKDYGWSARRMNKELAKRGIQYKQGKQWFLYQEYAENGYTSTKTHTFLKHDGTTGCRVNTYWTQKGRLFVYDELKKDGILPEIERN